MTHELPVLVETPNLTINLADADKYVVCTECRGEKVKWRCECHGDLWSRGWAMYERWAYDCPQCFGFGYWKPGDARLQWSRS